jgi:primary-amine oxidase
MALPSIARIARSVSPEPTLLSLATLLALSPAGTLAGQVPHPLDPLTFQEHWTVLEVLREADRYDGDTGVSLVLLQEPGKDVVRGWEPGQPFDRAALVVLRREAETYEAVVDLTARRLLSWERVEGGQAPWLSREFAALEDVIKEHPEVVEAMARRGITDLTFIDCGAGPPGRFGLPEEEGRRIARGGCVDARGVRNHWTRGIEGLVVILDVDAREVIRVVDEGPIPVPTTVADFDEASLGPLRRNPTPLSLHQPLGPAFELDGFQVRWDRWRFHVRPDHRVGAVVSTVRWVQEAEERPVLYQGHMSEIFVPYMDPTAGWYTRNFLDIGEYTAGGLVKPLQPEVDCPGTSAFLPLIHAGDDGRPRTVPDVICIFERYAGDPLWRHLSGTHEGRAKRDLVVRMAAVLGNYDYIVDWVFQQDGTIRVAVGATGIVEAKPVLPTNALAAAEDGDGGGSGADAYGRFVDRNIVAVNHDHYFSFRLDMEVDGPSNSLQVDELTTVRLADDHPRRSLWVVESRVAEREADAKLDMDMHRPAHWRVVNPARTNTNGYPSSYQLVPGMNVHTLLTADDYPRRRAGFIDHHLWVTPYDPDERYAAGTYPTLSDPDQGLPAWTAANRSIRDTDIVLWYTFGMHHVPRAEDWPVMPVVWQGFELRPFDFFDRNPSMDAPRLTTSPR